ncbi:uncharacterized protein C8Q71DRAFT_525907 [Rhodofomes roseus]|uniref:Uncharacterized protein n=1 Tax=Rhodofomes roseus TaxID=34475 RepID=A0ABQ8KJS7_9APHY|nr:uncharacterized protein C8Q71DRAFT_525907 [Rhodofomes roseus]KAH9838370.1 hypothetical protein C8Q71DRAFT_525907 [Rhodofomes roseus]
MPLLFVSSCLALLEVPHMYNHMQAYAPLPSLDILSLCIVMLPSRLISVAFLLTFFNTFAHHNASVMSYLYRDPPSSLPTLFTMSSMFNIFVLNL